MRFWRYGTRLNRSTSSKPVACTWYTYQETEKAEEQGGESSYSLYLRFWKYASAVWEALEKIGEHADGEAVPTVERVFPIPILCPEYPYGILIWREIL